MAITGGHFVLMLYIAINVLVVNAAFGAKENKACTEVLRSAGASPSFDIHVGHVIHSMTVETLRRFDPSATVDNKVPTVNLYAESSEDVLRLNAPVDTANRSTQFATEGMNVLDRVLSKMDSERIFGETTLEKVVHAFHMEEMWKKMLPVYRRLQANPPADLQAVCKCALDVKSNGILQILRVAAMKWREPGLMHLPVQSRGNERDSELHERYLVGVTLLSYSRSVEAMTDINDELTGAAAWRKYVTHLKSMGEPYDPALFLYCALTH